ncbi:hypothetical protein PVL29_022312 [Vitis rotundifolia]|uniref:COBRA-like protein n=1 Tax=Vitis rotundifolia TaxID=103349 RepID=A0AA38YV32_VITRO|nr:hypothetical protein PVL29_022312 [Vitis rotundifolia]
MEADYNVSCVQFAFIVLFLTYITSFWVLVALFLYFDIIYLNSVSFVSAYDVLDPYGNIMIKWDVVSWTPDGYVAVVTLNNLQMYQNIMSPGWTLGWTWAKKKKHPHCCRRNPTVIDLLHGAPYTQQIAGCCKGGVLASQGQDPRAAVSAFQLSNFTLLGPGTGYTCSQATIEAPSLSLSSMCTYSQLVASAKPRCCVSFSSFYSDIITPCPSCACGCQNENNCVISDSKIMSKVEMNTTIEDAELMLKCTQHMCPIRVHWHVKANYKEYWRVKIAITNFNYIQWTLLLQHPNLNNVAQVYSFVYKPLVPYKSINDTGIFYGIKYSNDILREAGPDGNVQSELIFRKDMDLFTLKQGWVFPHKVYFNGDECMMPAPDSYPFLPNSAHVNPISYSTLPVSVLLYCYSSADHTT